MMQLSNHPMQRSLLFLLLFSCGRFYGETLTLDVNQDAQLYGAQNQGTLETFLVLANRFDALLRFNLDTIPGTIQSAKLKLYVVTPIKTGPHQLYILPDDSWEELTVTNQARPKEKKEPVAQWTPAAGLNEIDVTQIAGQEQTLPGQMITFYINGTVPGPQGVAYAAKEHANPEFRPKLEIEYTPGGELPISILKTNQDFRNAAVTAKPGTILKVAEGIYEDVAFSCKAQGTEEKPIRFCAETPGKVLFTTTAKISLKNTKYFILEGFVFERVIQKGSIISLQEAEKCRITSCAFIDSGDPIEAFSKVILIASNSCDNRVDNCLFQGNLCDGLAINYNSKDNKSFRNQFDHNYFKNISARGKLGQEALQLGSFGQTVPVENVVEYNLFENAAGMPGILSIGSGKNVVRYNTFRGSKSEVVVKGAGNRIEGNFFFNNKGGVCVSGPDQTVANNYIEGSQSAGGIRLLCGDQEAGTVAASRCTITRNTLVNCESTGIYVGAVNPTAAPPVKPAANRITDNIVVGKADPMKDEGSSTVISGNIAWGEGKVAGLPGFEAVDPHFVNANGYNRVSHADGEPKAGCSSAILGGKFGRPITFKDVGPEWMVEVKNVTRLKPLPPEYNMSFR